MKAYMQSSKSARSTLVRYGKIWISGSWLISLVVAVFTLALADFGGPSWIFILCGLWLGSLGLPTTLSLLALAGIWGRIPGVETPPLSAFAVSVATLSLVAQTISFHVVIRFFSLRRKS